MERLLTSPVSRGRFLDRLLGGPIVGRACTLAAAALILLATGSAGAGAAIVPPTTSTTSPPPVSEVELPTFHLPFVLGVDFGVSQGNAGLFTHQARRSYEFAWDFAMPEGTMLSLIHISEPTRRTPI